MSGPGARPHSLSDKLHVLVDASLRYVRARVDLLQREFQQERTRVLGVVARAAIFAVGVIMTYQMTATFLLVAFWDTPWRTHVAGGLVLVTAGITFGAWRAMRKGGDQAAQPFSNSIAEFDKDRMALERIAKMADTTTPATPPKPTAAATRPAAATKVGMPGSPTGPAATASTQPSPSQAPVASGTRDHPIIPPKSANGAASHPL